MNDGSDRPNPLSLDLVARDGEPAGQVPRAGTPSPPPPLPSFVAGVLPPPWFRGVILAYPQDLTRTRATRALALVRAATGEDSDLVTARFEATAVLAAGLPPTAAFALRDELGALGVHPHVLDAARLMPCPPAQVARELRWDDAGLRIQSDLGVHACGWDEPLLLLHVCLGERGSEEVPFLDLTTTCWERFRLGLDDPSNGINEDPWRPSRLVGALLGRRAELTRNEAVDFWSSGMKPAARRVPDAAHLEAWERVWLGVAREGR